MAIRIERDDGTARILGCRADVGVNAETAYCQIVADELGVRVGDVFFQTQDDAGFFPMAPDSSTNTSVNGFALRNAARLLKQKILKAAATPGLPSGTVSHLSFRAKPRRNWISGKA